MPPFEEQHLAHLLAPLRLAIALGETAAAVRRGLASSDELTKMSADLEREAAVFADGSAAIWQESLRRVRHQPRPRLGDPEPAQIAPQVPAAAAEALAALQAAMVDLAEAALEAESPEGRLGELAVELADVAAWGRELSRAHGDPYVERRVAWGRPPGSAAARGLVALGVSCVFCLSTCSACMLYLDESLQLGADEQAPAAYEAAVWMLSAAEELAVCCSVGLRALLDGAAGARPPDPATAFAQLLDELDLHIADLHRWPHQLSEEYVRRVLALRDMQAERRLRIVGSTDEK